ncbi:MAG TPA: VIT1/CCC1 family protein [Dehalococcoidia bacterium]|nr:VIT1/CCC1 family protein [Dehalococcoidia bacterium]
MAAEQKPASREDVRRWQANLKGEWEASALYRSLADAEKDPARADVLRQLAAVEEQHAARWEGYLRDAGAPLPKPGVSLRGRVLRTAGRRFGVGSVLPMVMANELSDVSMYDDQPDAAGLPQQERSHARIFSAMANPRGVSGSQIAAGERWHRRDAGGGLRAAVFGVNDGLVSNLSLVFGVAGANPGRSFILLTGLAGLLAGAFSMAAGEYISITSQRELFQRQIALEQDELETAPEEEAEELALIYQAKGIPRDDAERLAHRIIGDKDVALDTLTREELGLDPEALGSPWTAASSSAVSFATGAIFPVLPYFISMNHWLALGLSAAFAAVALVVVGLGISLVNGRSPWLSAARMLLVGAIAASVTVVLGHLIGVSTS